MYNLYLKCKCGNMLLSDGRVFVNMEDFNMKEINRCPSCSRNLYKYNNRSDDELSEIRCYRGDTKNRKRHGFGSYTYLNGNIYFGEWKDNKEHGYGILKLRDGTLYAGEWVSGNMCGKGVIIVPDADIFMGEIKDSRTNGKGIVQFADGKVLVGRWKDSKRSERCTLFNPDGTIEHDGYYEDDNYLGNGQKEDD